MGFVNTPQEWCSHFYYCCPEPGSDVLEKRLFHWNGSQCRCIPVLSFLLSGSSLKQNWHFFSSQLNIYYHFQKTHSKFTTDLLYQQHFFFPKTALNKISPDKAKAPRRTLTTHLQLYSKPYFSFSLSRICGKLSGAVIWA